MAENKWVNGVEQNLDVYRGYISIYKEPTLYICQKSSHSTLP